jgi:hypothetical protein
MYAPGAGAARNSGALEELVLRINAFFAIE